jgi:hypothetical protein
MTLNISYIFTVLASYGDRFCIDRLSSNETAVDRHCFMHYGDHVWYSNNHRTTVTDMRRKVFSVKY